MGQAETTRSSSTHSVLRQRSGPPRPRERGPRLPHSGPRRKCSLGSLHGGARRGRGEAAGGGAQSDEQGPGYGGAGLAEGETRLRRAVRQPRAPWGRAGLPSRRASSLLSCVKVTAPAPRRRRFALSARCPVLAVPLSHPWPDDFQLPPGTPHPPSFQPVMGWGPLAVLKSWVCACVRHGSPQKTSQPGRVVGGRAPQSPGQPGPPAFLPSIISPQSS